MDPRSTRVAVLMGGTSAERTVSLAGGAEVARALDKAGFDVVSIDTGDDDFIEQLAASSADVAFICLHGRFGEDGSIQGLCELLGLRYIGSGVLASALAMDKVMSKHFFAHSGISTPEYAVVHFGETIDLNAIVDSLGEKVVVKPANEGSSLGMSIVEGSDALAQAIDQAFVYDKDVLIERFVEGIEVTIGVLGNDMPRTLPSIEVVTEGTFYDYASKYTPGGSRHVIPARISPEATAECERLALAAHRALGCRGLSRADMIVTKETVHLLEVNTIPGMTPVSLFPDMARADGMEFDALCTELIGLALEPRS